MPRPEVMSHMLGGDNVALCFIRNSREQVVSNFLVAEGLVDKTNLYPLRITLILLLCIFILVLK